MRHGYRACACSGVVAIALLFSACPPPAGNGSATPTPSPTASAETPSPSPSISFVVSHDWKSFGSTGFDDALMAVQSGDKVYIGTQSAGLVYSDDGGTAWSVKNYANDGIANNQICDVALSGDLVFMATFNGLSVWNRVATVSPISNYLEGIQVYDIIVDGTNLYLAASDGVYHGDVSAPGSLVRATTSFASPESICLSGASLYAAGDSDGTNVEPINVFNTAAWGDVPARIDVNTEDSLAVGPIWSDGTRICLGINYELFHSADGGTSFVSAPPLTGGTVKGIIPVGSALVSVRYGGNLWHSTDSGASWTGYAAPGYDGFAGIIANGVSYDGSEILIAHDGGVLVGRFQ